MFKSNSVVGHSGLSLFNFSDREVVKGHLLKHVKTRGSRCFSLFGHNFCNGGFLAGYRFFSSVEFCSLNIVEIKYLS